VSQTSGAGGAPLPVSWGEGLGRELTFPGPGLGHRLAHHPKRAWRSAGGPGHRRSPVDLELPLASRDSGPGTAPPAPPSLRAGRRSSSNWTHQRQLVVAGFCAGVARHRRSPHRRAWQQEELRLQPRCESCSQLRHPLQLTAQAPARAGTAPVGWPLHCPESVATQATLRWPGQHRQAGGIGQGEHVRVRPGHVQPGGKSRAKPAPSRAACLAALGWHELGARCTRRIREGEEGKWRRPWSAA